MKKRYLCRKKRNWIAYVILFMYSAVVVIPVVYAVLNSFKPSVVIQQDFFGFNLETINLDAYRSAITLLNLWEGLRNNAIVLSISLSLTVLFSSLAAFAIVIVATRPLTRFYNMLIVLICIPIHAFVFQLVPLLKVLGLLNTYSGTAFIFTALSIPVSVFLYVGFMRNVPHELNEAAIIDGCGILGVYAFIYMPLMVTVTGTVLILRGTYIWNNLLVSMVTITNKSKTLLIPRTYAFNSSTYTRWDLVLASAVLVSLPATVVYIFMQKVFIRGIVAGAVKG